MDYNRLIEVLIVSIFGGGGTVSLVNYLRARKSKKAGMSKHEKVAASQVIPAPIPIGTPDWEALTHHWQTELKLTREEYRQHRIECDKQHRADARHIDILESWIWERKAPPPPRPEQEEQK
jgi:hypothetical protein